MLLFLVSAWFNGEPAVICFGDIQLEITVYQIGLLAITWNTIDLSGPANWLGCWDLDDDHYRWRRATNHPFAAAIGQGIQNIHVADGQSGVDAIRFECDAGVLVLYNARDELGGCDQALDPKNYLLHPIPASSRAASAEHIGQAVVVSHGSLGRQETASPVVRSSRHRLQLVR